MITSPPSAASLQGSEVSISASNGLDGKPNGKSSSTTSTGLSLLTDFPLPPDMQTYVTFAQQRRTEWTALPADSPVRISATPACPGRPDDSGSRGHEAACSLRQCVLSPKYGPDGWSSKTSKLYVFPTRGEISPPSLSGFETAGMWDSGGLWTRNISEAPAAVAVSSWSQVIVSPPPWSCWLMPHQWTQYLARCLRSTSQGAWTHSLAILYRQRTHEPASLWGVNFSWLKRTDGIRWLTGREALSIMGFGAEWMTPTLRSVGVPEMPSTLVSRGGSQKN